MKNYITIIFTICLLVSSKLMAQSGHKIEFKITNVKEKQFLLGHYFGADSQILKDTAKLNTDGFYEFSGKNTLPTGQYIITFGKDKAIELIITEKEQAFRLETDTLSFVNNMKILGSDENTAYYFYLKEMNKFLEEVQIINLEAQFKKEQVSKLKLQGIYKNIDQFKRKFVKDNAKLFTSKMIKVSLEPLVPELVRVSLKGKKDSLSQLLYYYKNHFMDGVDFTEKGLVFTKSLLPKMTRYMNELTYQTADSLIKSAENLVQLAKNNQDIQKYFIYKLASIYERSKIIGGENVFVHIGRKYYQGQPQLWDSTTVKKIIGQIDILEPLLVGKIFPNLALADTLGKLVNTNEMKAKYTFQIFYDPDCSHCKKSAPELTKIYPSLKKRGVEYVWVCVVRNPYFWRKFIRDYHLEAMPNLIDIHLDPITKEESNLVDFQKLDLYATPVIYVLDQNKKILAKRLSVNELGAFIDFVEKKK